MLIFDSTANKAIGILYIIALSKLTVISKLEHTINIMCHKP